MSSRTLLPLLATTVLLSACSKPHEPVYEDIRQVKLLTVGTGTSDSSRILTGDVRARHETPLAFRVAGKVSARLVDVGAEVKAGQVLARLDAADYQLGVNAARAQQQAVETERAQNARDLARFTQLRDQGFISNTEYERRRAQLDTSNARLGQAEAEAAQSRNQVSYTELRADADGVVTQFTLEVGQVVGAGQPVGWLSQRGEPEVSVTVPESSVDAIRKAAGFSVSLWAVPGKTYKGELRELAPQGDVQTRTFNARIRILEADPAVRPGMTAQVAVAEAGGQPVLRLPIAALLDKQSQPVVWTLDRQHMTVHRAPVKIGRLLGDEVEVTAGLQSGQQVVAAGAHLLHEGQKVRPAEGL